MAHERHRPKSLLSFHYSFKIQADIVPACRLCQGGTHVSMIVLSNMATGRTRNSTWTDDTRLKEELQKYVKQGLQRSEILSFVERDFAEYAWSKRTLDRRLQYFDIYQTDRTVSVEDVRAAVSKELEGPGQLVGYRAMYHKIRQGHNLNAPRNLVHAVMYDLDPEGLESRQPMKRQRREKGHFVTKGTDWVHSMDGHDKMMGYQNSTFPLAIYGSIDTASRKILWLKIWTSNSCPKRIGSWYLEHLHETRQIASMIRVDKGTETGMMATMHSYLRQSHGDMNAEDTVLYGPSTSNQVLPQYVNRVKLITW
jgi:hypothetical protein